MLSLEANVLSICIQNVSIYVGSEHFVRSFLSMGVINTSRKPYKNILTGSFHAHQTFNPQIYSYATRVYSSLCLNRIMILLKTFTSGWYKIIFKKLHLKFN